MANTNFQEQSASYISKLDQASTRVYTEWWNSLTKEELLAYINDQPTITVDDLRKLFANAQTTLNVGTAFNVATQSAVTDFRLNQD